MGLKHRTSIVGRNGELCVVLPDDPPDRILIGFRGEEKPRLALRPEEVHYLVQALVAMNKDAEVEIRRRTIAAVEAMSPVDVRNALADHGIERGANLAEYSRAKRVIFRGMVLKDQKIYDSHIKTIARYLGMV